MQTIYNSPLYCVVRFAPAHAGAARRSADGFEILDKTLRRQIFLHGRDADEFRRGVERLLAGDLSEDQMDDFLSGYRGLMTTPVALH